jgi:nucleoside-diphosphate-sugar epimerase
MRAMMPTYSIGKIAGEVVVRAAARQHRVPTTIARLNVPYSATSGLPQMHALSILRDDPVPVYPGDSNAFAPIHLTDVVRTVPALLAAASLPATIVNWGGEETVSVMEWSRCLAQLLGREVRFAESDAVMGGMVPDIARLRSLVAPLPITTVSWQDGMRQIAAASDPAAAPLAGTGPT